jgi:hypothetical protein
MVIRKILRFINKHPQLLILPAVLLANYFGWIV